jgi:hypothetical protein
MYLTFKLRNFLKLDYILKLLLSLNYQGNIRLVNLSF